ncbi:Ig-like domain-containing protein [Haloplanus litoreus]|uniref:Ig-like domain-containing protein n=1 Tax=Haloplanus litoreus TaxID=767515 RepID=A0ABD5ZVH3_9EURY
MIALVVVSGVAPAVAAAPSLSVTVDGSTVADGETVTITDDPLIGIEASGDGTIESVELRIDGETRRSYQPGAESFSDTVDLDLDDGEHEMTVVAEGSGTTRRTMTVRKDSDGPRVSYTSPFTTERTGPTGTVTIEEADTTIAGELFDQSGVEMVRIERNYEWTFAGQSRRDRTTYRIDDPGENFSRPLLFGLGENEMRVEVIDVHGQRSTHDFTVEVVDGTRPSISLDRFERRGNTLDVAGVVDDNVKVKSLSVRAASGEKSVLTETSKEPNRERVSADFEFTTRVTDETEEITLVATDVAGNTREWSVPLDYRGHLVPTISIDREATRVDGEAVAVAGLVSEGQVTRVVAETVGPDGSTVSTATVYEGEATDRVPVSARLGSADGETTVVVRAVDADGREHEETLTLATGGGQETVTAAESTPAETTTVAPSTPVTTTTAAEVDAAEDPGQPRSLGLGAATNRLPVPASLPFPLSLPLPVPFAGTVLVLAVLGLAMAISNVTEIETDDGATTAATGRTGSPAESGETDASRETVTGGAGPGEPAAGTPSADPRGHVEGPADRDAEPRGSVGATGSPEPTDRPTGTGNTDPTARPRADEGVDESTAPPDADSTPDPEPAFDVTDHLGVASIADVDAADVSTLVEQLDDAESVADAARGLAEVAAERPALLRDTDAESRLRDLRLDPDPAVSDAASEAVHHLTEADD